MKDKILHFAKNKFIAEGFNHATMDELAQEMQVSKKTIYKYFRSKQELIEQILKSTMEEIALQIGEIAHSEMKSPEKLYVLSQYIVGEIRGFSNKWLKDIQVVRPDLWKKIEKFRRKTIMENFEVIITQGKEEGFIIDEPTPIILAIILSSVQTVLQPDFILHNNVSVKDAGEISLNIIFNGILTSKGKTIFKKFIKRKNNEKK